jgi:hypothetical protein
VISLKNWPVLLTVIMVVREYLPIAVLWTSMMFSFQTTKIPPLVPCAGLYANLFRRYAPRKFASDWSMVCNLVSWKQAMLQGVVETVSCTVRQRAGVFRPRTFQLRITGVSLVIHVVEGAKTCVRKRPLDLRCGCMHEVQASCMSQGGAVSPKVVASRANCFKSSSSPKVIASRAKRRT